MDAYEVYYTSKLDIYRKSLKKSSLSLGNVICWQDADHGIMVGLSVVPFFGGVCSFMALVIWAVVQYPLKVSSSGGAPPRSKMALD